MPYKNIEDERKYRREWAARRALRLRERNLCIDCGYREPVEGVKECAECKGKSYNNYLDRRDRLKNQGICVCCGQGSAIDSQTKCRSCATKDKKRLRDYSKTFKVLHVLRLCQWCKDKIVKNKVGRGRARIYCDDCIPYIGRQKDNERIADRVSVGLCGHCGKWPVVSGRRHCQVCLDKGSERSRKSRGK